MSHDDRGEPSISVEDAIALAERHVAAIDAVNDALDFLDAFSGSAVVRTYVEEYAAACAAARRDLVVAVEAFQCDAFELVRALLGAVRDRQAGGTADDAP